MVVRILPEIFIHYFKNSVDNSPATILSLGNSRAITAYCLKTVSFSSLKRDTAPSLGDSLDYFCKKLSLRCQETTGDFMAFYHAFFNEHKQYLHSCSKLTKKKDVF
jgi:hypothetical protein